MHWVKSRSYEIQPNEKCDGVSVVTCLLRSDGGMLTINARKGVSIDSFWESALSEKQPFPGITEQEFDNCFEKQMKEDNGTEVEDARI